MSPTPISPRRVSPPARKWLAVLLEPAILVVTDDRLPPHICGLKDQGDLRSPGRDCVLIEDQERPWDAIEHRLDDRPDLIVHVLRPAVVAVPAHAADDVLPHPAVEDVLSAQCAITATEHALHEPTLASVDHPVTMASVLKGRRQPVLRRRRPSTAL